MKPLRSLLGIILMFAILSCAEKRPPRSSTPEYTDVDFGRMVAPESVGSLKGQLVRVRAAFFSTTSGDVPAIFSNRDFLGIQTVAPGGATLGSRPRSPEMLTIIVPAGLHFV